MTVSVPRNHNDEMENARAEYAATNEVYLHYDNYSWQVGSILVAGSLAYWGFLAQSTPALLSINIGNLLITLVMTIWALYASHNRQIYVYKLHRLQELEKKLNMEQHRRFKKSHDSPAVYSLSWPSGHLLDDAIYVLISVGGVVIGWNLAYKGEWNSLNWTLFLAVPFIVVMTLLRIHHVERTTNPWVERREKT